MSDHDSLFKHILDAVSAGVAVGTITKMLPEISAAFTIVWLGIRIWESDTVRGWTNRHKLKDYIDTLTFRRMRDKQ